jgi:hypothetical protein
VDIDKKKIVLNSQNHFSSKKKKEDIVCPNQI